MALYFLDTSAIVKRYFPEQGHAWITTLCEPEQKHNLYISQAAPVEVVAATCRREREHSVTLEERNTLIATFRQDSRDSYEIWPVTTDIYTFAGDSCRSHRLRAYDAVQLACALAIQAIAIANQAPDLTFVCADLSLLVVATAEGLKVENPNNYS